METAAARATGRRAGAEYDVPPCRSSLRFALEHMLPEERQEFLDEADRRWQASEAEPTPENRDALICYVRSWVVSIVLREDPEWGAENERTSTPEYDDGPVDADGLRELLSRP